MSADPSSTPERTKRILGTAFLVAATWLGASMLSESVSAPPPLPKDVPYSDFVKRTEAKEITTITQGFNGALYGKSLSGNFKTYVPPEENAYGRLKDTGVVFATEKPAEPNPWLGLLLNFAPLLLFGGLWFFMMRRMGGGAAGGALALGKSKAKQQTSTVTLADVAGAEEAKEDLAEIVSFLKAPDKYTALGGRSPKGTLLVGPAGTGKTLLARAVAGEAEVPFFSLSGSEFVEMFVGVGASRVRDLFTQAKKKAPCIIFIDEIDAVGRQRGAGLGGGHDEREQTLNQLLVEMDGFEPASGVVVLACTNRPDVLDPALLRAGRFDRRIVVGLPDIDGREKILRIHTRKLKLEPGLDLRLVARGTPGFCGADLENLANEAALKAARRGGTFITAQDFDLARDKILMGEERKINAMSETEKRMTACHESGHALVAHYTAPLSDPIHKATILPRGMALGMVQQLPERDAVSHSRAHLKARLAVMMGGRAAEVLCYGEDGATTGPSNDIEKATEIARRMVTEWGMSELGPVRFEGKEQEVFLGRSVSQTSHLSEETARKIDDAVVALLNEAVETATQLIEGHKQRFDVLADTLYERETLSGADIGNILDERGALPAPAPRITGPV